MLALLYQIGILIVAVSLPFSNFGMSVGSFWILGAWIIDQFTTERKTLRYRWAKAFRSPLFWILLLLFMVHVFGLVHTKNYAYAIKDLRIKLPLLLFPVVFFTARPIEGIALRRMWMLFVLACGAAAVWCLLIAFGVIDREVYNIRDVSVFISHIRFSMLLVFASAVLLLWLSDGKRVVLSLVLLAVNVAFLWVIESMTGAILLGFTLILFMVSNEASVLGAKTRRILGVTLLLSFIVTTGLITYLAYDYFALPDDYTAQLEQQTPRGNAYEHHPENTMRENGEFVWRYIAWGELSNAWNQRSSIAFDSLDARNQQVSGTLIRYLTSKGLRKDQDGVQALTQQDIANIEAGIPTVLELEHNGLRRRLDKIFFEIAHVRNGGNPGGNSVTQRLEFWKAAWYVIGQRPVFGVGTGDVKDRLDEAYEAIDSRLAEDFRLRPHNQYLSFWMAFGILGLLVLLAVPFMPFGVQASERGFLFTVFVLMMALSFLTEDTLETQAGVTFFAFFAALFSGQRLAFHSRIRAATSDGLI